ncbi:hypothetical protein SFMTTN_1241 [Sulfuriferula multivorans]|uniref:Uncharacterized protein n=1 Tax=Sulfuriferula multivorans TaxID=1559896 RepID=A0A401JCX0_9PROT|nr:hypothetical protein SFMTTN_1241 [Sulfuriferula multivorans]
MDMVHKGCVMQLISNREGLRWAISRSKTYGNLPAATMRL